MYSITAVVNKILNQFGLHVIKIQHSYLKKDKKEKIYDLINSSIVPELDSFNVNFEYGKAVDSRLRVRGVNTVLEESLQDIIDFASFSGKKVLEVGPKFGFHSLWIDNNIKPSLLVLSELISKKECIEEWVGQIHCPHEIVYGDMLVSECLHELGPFDLVFFTGVLYHNVEQLKMLSVLWNLTCEGGTLVMQSSVFDSLEPLIKLSWQPEQKGSYCYPSPKALLTMLAMTGWNDLTIFPDYRPNSKVILLTCKKSQEQYMSYSKIKFGGSF